MAWETRSVAPVEGEDFAPDPATLERVRDILVSFSNTVSAMKIFPAEHVGVRDFVDEFARRLGAFLEDVGKLEIGIREHEFTFAGRPLFRDDPSVRSFPFFFHKDGMLALAFYRGMTREEIGEFLEIVRRESRKPPDESDIVNALWERDLPNVHYVAPDEFIAGRILSERNESLNRAGLSTLSPEFAAKSIDGLVDRDGLGRGRVDLLPDDVAAVRKARRSAGGTIALGPEESPPAAPGRGPADERSPSAGDGGGGDEAAAVALAGTEVDLPEDSSFLLPERDQADIDALVQANRAIRPEEEFLNLMIELLHLESDAERFQATLQSLTQYHVAELRKGNIHAPLLMIRRVNELRQRGVADAPWKTGQLTGFLRGLVGPEMLDLARESLRKTPDVDPAALAEYLDLVGAPALSLAADLYEDAEAPPLREALFGFLRDMGERDPGLLACVADPRRPRVSREVVRFLAAHRDPKAVLHMASVLASADQALKLEAIQALSARGSDMAEKVLQGFLSDADETVRVEAALRLRGLSDPARLGQLLREVTRRRFLRKSAPERTAIFGLIGRSAAPEASDILRRMLRRRSFRPDSSAERLRVGAAAGLGQMPTPEAEEALRQGARSRNPRVKDACEQALRRRRAEGRTP